MGSYGLLGDIYIYIYIGIPPGIRYSNSVYYGIYMSDIYIYMIYIYIYISDI